MTTASANIQSLLVSATAELGSDSPRLDAECLLAFVLGKERSYLFAWPEKELDERQLQQFHDCLERRKLGEPVAYITGEREFWSLPILVAKGVLIPRPDTEILVEEALKRLPGNKCRIADLGTGSGAIALALAHERPDCEVIAVDQSDQALAMASENARRLGLGNLSFLKASWCDGLDDPLDMIVSNPPYICHDDPHLNEGDVRFEPNDALVAGADGLDDIRLISQQAIRYLHDGGWLLLEHGYDQGASVADLLVAEGYQGVITVADLSGNDRVTLGQKPG